MHDETLQNLRMIIASYVHKANRVSMQLAELSLVKQQAYIWGIDFYIIN